MEWSPSLTESIHPHQTVQQQHPNRTNCKMSLRPVPPNELLPENEYKVRLTYNLSEPFIPISILLKSAFFLTDFSFVGLF